MSKPSSLKRRRAPFCSPTDPSIGADEGRCGIDARPRSDPGLLLLLRRDIPEPRRAQVRGRDDVVRRGRVLEVQGFPGRARGVARDDQEGGRVTHSWRFTFRTPTGQGALAPGWGTAERGVDLRNAEDHAQAAGLEMS